MTLSFVELCPTPPTLEKNGSRPTHLSPIFSTVTISSRQNLSLSRSKTLSTRVSSRPSTSVISSKVMKVIVSDSETASKSVKPKKRLAEIDHFQDWLLEFLYKPLLDLSGFFSLEFLSFKTSHYDFSRC
jgi:hypothetical protein